MTTTKTDEERRASPYQFFILVLCLWALGSLAVGSALTLDAETQTILDYADNVVCGLFFADFLFTLYTAPRKWAYLLTWGWLDLLSSIPTVAVAQRARSAFLAAVLLGL